MPDSKRSSRGFKQLPGQSPEMVGRNGVEAAIPLNEKNASGKSGNFGQSRRQPTYLAPPSNEKTGFYQKHVAGRRRTAKKGAMHDHEEEGALTQMGMIYNKILNFSLVTRYVLYILPVGIILTIPIIIGATAATNATLGGVRIVWFFSWLLIVWSSLWGSKLFAKYLPAIFQFLCGIVSSGTRKYAMILQSLEIYLSLAGWALASLATFIPVCYGPNLPATEVR